MPAALRSLITPGNFEDDYTAVGAEMQIQQAGRTATPIAAHAQASTQSLQQFSRPHYRRALRLASSTPNIRAPTVPAINVKAAEVAQARRVALHAPIVSSPLSSTVKSPDGAASLDTSHAFTSESNGFQARTLASQFDDTLLKPPTLHGVLRARWSTASAILSQPRSISDLGSDYSRYFNPFVIPKPTVMDLRSQQSRPVDTDDAVTGQALPRRLSNPAHDGKRLSTQSLSEVLPVSLASHPNGPSLPRQADTPYFIRQARS